MINPQLLDYIRQQFAVGISKEEVRKALLINNWQMVDIDEAFASIANSLSVISSPVIQVPGQDFVQPAVSSHKGMIAIVIVLLLLVGAGGAFAAYQAGLITLPFSATTAPLPDSNTVSTIPTAVTAASSTNQATPSATPVVATSTKVVTTPSSVKTTTQVQSEIDQYGVDLYKLKQGVTTINKATQTKTEVVYTRNGDALETKTSVTVGSGTAAIFTNSTTIYPSEIDNTNDVNLSTLKQGVTTINKTIPTTLKIAYTRTANKVERKVAQTDSSGGTGTTTSDIDLNAVKDLPAVIHDTEVKVAAACSDSTNKTCAAGEKFVNFLKTTCLPLKTNEEVSGCMLAAAFTTAAGSL